MTGKFPDFPAGGPSLEDFRPNTVAWLIQRVLDDLTDQPDARRPRGTHLYSLHAMQRYPIGKRTAHSLKRGDIIEFMKWRRKTAGASTANQTLCYLSGIFKYASAAWDDCENVSNAVAAIEAARPFLVKHHLVGTSAPRDRRPTADELTSLRELGTKRNGRRQTKINMELIMRWQPASGRRISETCRIEWRGWNPATQTMLVTKMKDPRRRDKNKVVALTDEAQEILLELALEMNANPKMWRDPQPRIFPYNEKSVCAAHYEMKKRLGIEDLRLHDNRRECGSRIIDAGGTSDDAILVTGHEDTKVFDTNYKRPNPELFRERMAKRMQARSQD